MWAGVPHAGVAGLPAGVAGPRQAAPHRRDVTPGLVFAASAAYGRAIEAVFAPDVEVGARRSARSKAARSRPSTTCWRPRRRPQARPRMRSARRHHRHSCSPRLDQLLGAVISTNRMICANQQMIRQRLRFPRRGAAGAGRLAAVEPHLRRQPTSASCSGTTAVRSVHRRRQADAQGMAETLRNLREISPTVYFNVEGLRDRHGDETDGGCGARCSRPRARLHVRRRLSQAGGTGWRRWRGDGGRAHPASSPAWA